MNLKGPGPRPKVTSMNEIKRRNDPKLYLGMTRPKARAHAEVAQGTLRFQGATWSQIENELRRPAPLHLDMKTTVSE
eukprot:10962515-Karenia_brevis.AAC.1